MANSLRLWWQRCKKVDKLSLMAIASLVVGIIALILAIGLYIKAWAAKSVIRSLQIEVLPNPICDGKQTYWLVQLIAGRGNIICHLLNKIDSSLVSTQLYATTRFELKNGDRYNSFAYDIQYGIRDKRIEFLIIPEIKKQLVVAQRFPDLSLRTMGDSFGNSELRSSGDLVIMLKDARQKVRKQFKIPSYIKESNPYGVT